MIYPDGRVLTDNYGATGSIDNATNRLSAVTDGSGNTLQSYSYMGDGTIVGEADGNGVSTTTTLDDFGRAQELDSVNTGTGATIDDLQYGYDADGNVLTENNVVNASQSELFIYDGLNRLTSFASGTLSASTSGGPLDTIVSPTATQSWGLNALGDMNAVTTNGTTVNQSISDQNQVTAVSGNPVTYDPNGNTLTDSNGQQYVYDAWNRLVEVKNSSGTLLESYSYDAMGHRITQAVAGGGTTTLYYSANWQVVQENQGSTLAAENVWGVAYVNQLVERDQYTTTDGTTTDQRFYAEQDANWDVVSLTDSSGNVVQRFEYAPYGAVTVLNADGTSADSETTPLIPYLFQGGRFDSISGLYNFQHRDYQTSGTWLEEDPDGYVDGLSLYTFERNDPPDSDDPSGLSRSNDLVIRLLDLRTRQDYDRNANHGQSGPNGQWLSDQIQQVIRELAITPTVFAVYSRNIRGNGPTETLKDRIFDRIGDTVFGGHEFVATVDRPWRIGELIGWGLTDTNAKRGAHAAPEYYSPSDNYRPEIITVRGFDPFAIPNIDTLTLTDSVIEERIQNHLATMDYSTPFYNCQDWATEALRATQLEPFRP